MIASFSLLNETELLSLTPELTLFLFPVGGLESHGPHLPLGTKLLQAEDWARALAENLQSKMPAWNLILMPLLPFTVDTVSSKIAFGVRPHVVRDALVDQCDGLKRLQFLNFAAVSSHLTPRQLSAIEDAGKIVSKKKANLISVTSAMVDSSEVWKSPMIPAPKEHGGAKDTAWVLKVNSKLVAPRFAALPEMPEAKPSPSRFFDYFRHQIAAYWGKPAQADPTTMAQKMEQEVGDLSAKIQVVFEKNQGKSYFRSGYRYYFVNGSFFKAYVLAILFFLSMLMWILWNLKDVFDV